MGDDVILLPGSLECFITKMKYVCILFPSECTVSDLGTTAAQGGVVDPRCTDRFVNSLPICNGVVCYNISTAMSEAVYICDDNFYLMGEATRVCQNDGNWNGRIPQCIMSPGIVAIIVCTAQNILAVKVLCMSVWL